MCSVGRGAGQALTALPASSALNLNIHFHGLLLDGMYTGGYDSGGQPCVQRVKAPARAELEQLACTISVRTGRYLERQRLPVRNLYTSYLVLEPADETGLDGALGSSITSATAPASPKAPAFGALPPASLQSYRVAVGPHQGRKAFSLQRLPPTGNLEATSAPAANVAGFSRHAGVAAARHERHKLERLCRYIARPAIAERRLSLIPHGNVRYQLKTPYRDGTTHVMLPRASCPPPFGPAFGCSKSLPATLSNRGISWRGWRRWCRDRV